MKVVIPTIGRAGRQKTLDALLAAGQEVTLVTAPKEVKEYTAALGGGDVRSMVHVVACPAKGIALTRQWILDNCADTDGKVLMFDDDLTFHTRRMDDHTKFVNASPKDVRALLKCLSKQLDKFAHVSMAPRQGGNRITQEFMDCSRPWRCFGYNVPKVRAAGAHYNKGMVQDDFDITLQLLKAGYPNRVVCAWVNDQGGHGVTPGGTSTYRTVENHNESILRLAKMHAPFVRVRETDYKSLGDGWGQRLEATVSWKQAFKSSGEAF